MGGVPVNRRAASVAVSGNVAHKRHMRQMI